VILGLEFSDNVDPTALATLGLALVTVGLLVAGWRSLLQTQRQITISQGQLEQTQSEIALSRNEVEEAHRPIVVALADHRRMSVAGPHMAPEGPCKPSAPANGRLIVPIENIGTGPALRIEASVSLRDEKGGPVAGNASGDTALGALRADGRLPLPFEVRGLLAGAAPAFEITVTYDDVAERRWRTSDVYLPAESAYRGPEVERVQGPSRVAS
jgi:hypothetical protein